MDPSVEEARRLLDQEESKLRQLPYDELQRLETPIVKELVAGSGNTYEIEIEKFWDDRRTGDLRVTLVVNPWYGWGILIPKELTTDFIMARCSHAPRPNGRRESRPRFRVGQPAGHYEV